MAQFSKLLTTLNKQLALAAVGITAAAVAIACSSSSSSAPFGSGEDAAAGDDATTGGDGGSEDASMVPTGPCDASIVLPASGMGAACGTCLKAHCMSQLALCQNDCVCVSSIMCLAVNDDNYTMCPDALSAIGAGNRGLTALGKCIVDSCTVCNDGD